MKQCLFVMVLVCHESVFVWSEGPRRALSGFDCCDCCCSCYFVLFLNTICKQLNVHDSAPRTSEWQGVWERMVDGTWLLVWPDGQPERLIKDIGRSNELMSNNCLRYVDLDSEIENRSIYYLNEYIEYLPTGWRRCFCLSQVLPQKRNPCRRSGQNSIWEPWHGIHEHMLLAWRTSQHTCYRVLRLSRSL